MKTRAELVVSLQAKLAEQRYLLDMLALWEAAEAQGVDSSDGGTFGLDTSLLTHTQKCAWHRCKDHFAKVDCGVTRAKLLNYFRYPDGRTVVLNPLLKAVFHG